MPVVELFEIALALAVLWILYEWIVRRDGYLWLVGSALRPLRFRWVRPFFKLGCGHFIYLPFPDPLARSHDL